MYSLMLLLLCAFMASLVSSKPSNMTHSLNIDSINSPANTFTSDGQAYTTHEPWCIFEEGSNHYSFAIVIPYDGSATEDGIDGKCLCGGHFKHDLRAKGVAITEWLVDRLSSIDSGWQCDRRCHYGPENSACISFNMPLIWVTLKDFIYPVYKSITGKALYCKSTGNIVCPNLYGNSEHNAGCSWSYETVTLRTWERESNWA